MTPSPRGRCRASAEPALIGPTAEARPPQRGGLAARLEAQAPAAPAHVREEQDDKDDCQDDVENHWASSSNRNNTFLRSIFGIRSNVLPVRGVRIPRWGGCPLRLLPERAPHRRFHDLPGWRVLRAHAMAEHERREPRHVFDLDGA